MNGSFLGSIAFLPVIYNVYSSVNKYVTAIPTQQFYLTNHHVYFVYVVFILPQ
jgi:hypothetical protein